MRSFLLFFASMFLLGINASGQNGSIQGKVVDENNEPLIGVNVIIKGTNIGSATNFDGDFLIGNVKPGSYTLFVSYISYKPKEMPVEVVSGKTAQITIKLSEDVATLSAVDITAERITYTEAAVLMEVKQASQVVSGVSSQEITRSPDKDAAQVASRVPGVTIIDNSFVMIRGLGQRYNNVMLNGITTPSTEPDSRAFSFDLIPSSVMDRMLIYKSGSADMPGDFAGGVIKLYTKGAPEYDLTEISFGMGYRHGTTMNSYLQNRAGSTDFLGFDRARSLPASFPGNLGDVSGADLEAAGKSLKNNFALTEQITAPDFKLGVNYGRNFKIKGKRAANLTSFHYGQSNQHLLVQRNRYTQDRAIVFDFQDAQIENETRLGLVNNWTLFANKRNRYTLKNTFNQIGERSTIIRTGVQPQERQFDLFRNYSFQYLSRTIFSSQLEGEHQSADARKKFTWVAGGAYIRRNEPDFRRLRSTRPIGDEDAPFTIIDPPGPTTFDNARFFSLLNEGSGSLSLAYEQAMGKLGESKEEVRLKAGFYGDVKARTFSARWISYVYPSFSDPVRKTQLVQMPVDQVFDPNNVSNVDGWRLAEGTNPSDAYDASTRLAAAYVGADIPFGIFNLAAGLRFESFNQQLNSQTIGAPLEINNTYNTPLPFANLSMAISDKAILRVAYSRTVNRPELRELAPFLYYNFKFDVNYIGEPNLIQADIHNVDLRWEYYPQNNETVSVGLFYKKFNNPIETFVQSVGLSQQFKLGNAQEATSYGIEIEARKSLGDVAAKTFLSKFFLIANASYIFTEVDLGPLTTLSQDRNRPLQGQSPYVINAGIHYRDDAKGNNVSLLYNVAGERIFFVGNDQFPTVYEMPRHMLDLVITKRMSARYDLKFGISDILNAPTRMVQDSNRDNQITDAEDDNILYFRRGTVWSASVVVRL